MKRSLLISFLLGACCLGCGSTRQQLQTATAERLRLEKELRAIKQEKIEAEIAQRDLLHRLADAEKQLARTTNELASVRMKDFTPLADPTKPAEPAPFVAKPSPAVADQPGQPAAPAGGQGDGWKSR